MEQHQAQVRSASANRSAFQRSPITRVSSPGIWGAIPQTGTRPNTITRPFTVRFAKCRAFALENPRAPVMLSSSMASELPLSAFWLPSLRLRYVAEVAMTQRPDLFCALICLAPLIDLLRYHRFHNTQFYIPDSSSPATHRGASRLE